MNQILCFRTDDQNMRALSHEKSMCSHLPEWLLSERQGIGVGKNMENRELKCTVGGNVNWWNHCKKNPAWKLLTKLKVELSYDPAILLLDINPKKMKTLIWRYMSHHFMGNRWGNSVRLFFGAPKSRQMVTAAMKLRLLLLGRKVMTNLGSLLKSRDIICQQRFV